MAGAVCIGGAPATLANAFVRPRVNDGERQRPLERLANGLLSWLSLLPATLFSAKAAAASKNLWISRAQNSDADNARLLFGWQGKLRGLDFEPPLFRIENMSSPDILNVAGKQVKIPVMLPISHAEAEDREDAIASRDANVLRIVAENPQAATRGLAFEAALSPPPYAIAGKIGQSKTRLSPTGTW